MKLATRKHFLYTLFTLFAIFNFAKAQTDTIPLKKDTIKTVVVSGEALRTLPPRVDKLAMIDRCILMGQLVESTVENLQQLSILSVREYGISNIASVSIRGMSSEQTTVLWEDVPLNSPALGQTDFSLINTAAATDFSINTANGSINLKTYEPNNTVKKINLCNINGKNWQSAFVLPFNFYKKTTDSSFEVKTKLSAWGAYNENSFLYKTTATAIEQPLTHAKNTNFGLLQTLSFSFPKYRKQTVQVDIWYQNSDRDLPPLLTQTLSRKAQHDESLRLKCFWKPNRYYQVTAAYLRDILIYNDSTSNIYAKSTMQRVFCTGAAFQYFKQGWVISEKIEAKQDAAKTDYYDENRVIRQINGRCNVDWKQKNWEITASISGISNNKTIAPLQYNASILYNLKKSLFAAKQTRYTRFPTLNDLYWSDGNTVGNLNLLPEQIDASELSYRAQTVINSTKAEFSLVGFYIHADNQIQWQPLANGGWSPKNIGNTVSKGATASVQFKWRDDAYLHEKTPFSSSFLRAILNLNYTYTDAQVYKDTVNYYAIYAPMHQANANLTLKWKHWQLSTDWQYHGKRYINAAPKAELQNTLPSYFLGNGSISYTNIFENNKEWQILLRVNNMLNTFYQSLENRPTALRFASIGAEIRF